MALAYLTINLDAFTGDDHPPISRYSTITLDPGADHIDAAADVIHVRTIVVSLDRQGKAATANGVPCVDGKVPVVAGVAYAVSAPNVLRGGPHYIPALTAGQVVDLSDYITPGAPLTPDQAAALAARVTALEDAPPGSHGALTGLGEDDHPIYLTTGRGDARYVQGTDPRLSDARPPTAHTHPVAQVSDSTTVGRTLVTAADAAAARAAIGAGTSNLTLGSTSTTAKAGDYAPAWGEVTGKPTTFAPSAHAHDASGITSGVLDPARLGTGTPSASTVLYGDGAWKAAPTGGGGSGPLTGTGSPEGVVTAPVGTYYTDTAITNGAMRWAKKTGTGSTGWRVIEGDTGWRDIRALYSENVVEAAAFSLSSRIIRVGDTVQYLGRVKPSGAVVGVARANAAGIQGVISTIPAGFMPLPSDNGPKGSVSVALSMQGQLANTASTSRLDLYMSASAAGVWAGTDVIFLSGSWPTRDAWPTTLPGTPA